MPARCPHARIRSAFALLLATLPSAGRPLLAADAPSGLCGRLSDEHGLRVLELWGPPESAGYAHGYLLAEPLVRLFDGYVLNPKVIPAPQFYETVLMPSVQRQFVWSEATKRELAGILAGVKARLGDKARSARLDRELRIEDLMIVNTLADWNSLFCSSFTAWGSRTSDGQPLTGRNLDFPAAGGMEREQFVLIRRGEGDSQAWVTMTWPGLIGVYTAMNASGVTMSVHDAPGLPASRGEGFTPRTLALREALEAAHADSYVDDIAKVLRNRRVMVGNNVHVSAPVKSASAAGPPLAVIFEYDANQRDQGLTIRKPTGEGDSLVDALCCTNHLRLRREPHECNRYTTLVERLGELASRHERLDAAGALQLMRSVEVGTTLHTVCFAPASRSMYVVLPSEGRKANEIRLDDWLNRRIGPAGPGQVAANPAGAAGAGGASGAAPAVGAGAMPANEPGRQSP